MKKITKKLSMKYVKLHKSRLRPDESLKSDEDGGELFREAHSPENEESNETKETPKVKKIMESMHRKLMLKEKTYKKNIHVDSHDQFQSSVLNNSGRDRKDQLEASVRNMNRDDSDQFEGSVRHNHMDHLEDLIRGKNGARNRVEQLEESSKKGQEHLREDNTNKPSDQVVQSERLTKDPSDFASKKDYIDWIQYVEGSNHHCFDRSENFGKTCKREDTDHDKISVGMSEGSVEGNNNDEIVLLTSSKKRQSDKFEGYKKGKGRKVKDSFKSQNN